MRGHPLQKQNTGNMRYNMSTMFSSTFYFTPACSQKSPPGVWLPCWVRIDVVCFILFCHWYFSHLSRETARKSRFDFLSKYNTQARAISHHIRTPSISTTLNGLHARRLTFRVFQAFKFFPKDRKMALVQLPTVDEAIASLVQLHNYQLSETSHLR